ncbi:NADH-flavin reductase [Lacticaseibacillus chiayiensis]|uniref:NAD(P)H-binding protein n=1 Tax=Lacticaseibacillus chiayiensis TaxID=2100821 RepID=A0A4Q1TVW5_9LACO|nr:NAD(P)H-binding protein [Lacticaseibacillus chiayiensis]QVI35284.1 NAD(P)H-binding protein [Lacticaseibacillus chiayiensis]RXT22465.1 NADH-flavin reductase [Lacticaseibacillus chiayiensis]UYN57065.1 NAD(P)H-binding protein [Lacticaseibacillus chiayiensis]
MKIAVLGATGRAGSAIVAEAQRRGHEVMAVVRDAQKAASRLGQNVSTLVKAPLELTEADLDDVDAVVDALSVPWGSGRGYLHLDFATHLISLLRNTDTLAVFILGSASLSMPGADHPMILDFPESVASQPWYDGAKYQYYEYRFLQMTDNVNWIGISASEAFPTGPATRYVAGKDTLLVGEDGQSHITTGNMALAILDQLERPTSVQDRMTVRDADA